MHHATFSINSLCHFFGRQDYDTGDESRNLAWLAIPTWGEAWHNNHHAFPTSYRHGLHALADRSFRRDHPRARDARPRVGRRPRRSCAPAAQGARAPAA